MEGKNHESKQTVIIAINRYTTNYYYKINHQSLFLICPFLQMQSTFLIQATYMRLEFNDFTVPAASLSIFDIVAVLAFIPIMDHVVYPLIQFCGIRFTPLRRIGVGLLLSAASVVVAGLIERRRRHVWQAGGVYIQTVFDEKREASTLNVFWQVPQFMLVGSSEVLTSITGGKTALKK